VEPFRWNLARREQLGRLLAGAFDGDPWWCDDEFQLCCARILAHTEGHRVFFVGRSLESAFDYLSGALCDTSAADRLNLFLFSMRYRSATPTALAAMRDYMRALHLDPRGVARSAVAFVDVVWSGETFSNLVGLLRDWCDEEETDWHAVRRNIRIVGVTQRTKTSPKTWRWHQHSDAMAMLPADAVKNVSLEPRMWSYLGNHQPKITGSYDPRRWGDDDVAHPDHNEKQVTALQEAWHIFEDGRTPAGRSRLAAMMTKTSGMQHAWFRRLLTEVKQSAG